MICTNRRPGLADQPNFRTNHGWLISGMNCSRLQFDGLFIYIKRTQYLVFACAARHLGSENKMRTESLNGQGDQRDSPFSRPSTRIEPPGDPAPELQLHGLWTMPVMPDSTCKRKILLAFFFKRRAIESQATAIRDCPEAN